MKSLWSKSRFKQWQGARKMCWGHKEGEEGSGDNAQSSEIQPGLLCVGVDWVSWLVLGAGGAFLGMEE